MEKNLKNPTSWVGGELSKRDSLFKDGILIRYDRMNKKFQCLYKIRNNMFGVANIGEGYLDEIGFFNLDLVPFRVFLGSLSITDWLRKPFWIKIQDVYRFLGAERTFGKAGKNVDLRKACKLSRISYDIDELVRC